MDHHKKSFDPGQDCENNPGSPLIALDELNDYGEIARKNNVCISLMLNEFSKENDKGLSGNFAIAYLIKNLRQILMCTCSHWTSDVYRNTHEL